MNPEELGWLTTTNPGRVCKRALVRLVAGAALCGLSLPRHGPTHIYWGLVLACGPKRELC